MTFAEDIEAAVGDELIEAVVIGEFGWDGYREDEERVSIQRYVPLSWETARPMLDYEYDTGYGAPECDAIWAWTLTRVLFVVQYDGTTRIEAVPRNPQDGKPSMPGG